MKWVLIVWTLWQPHVPVKAVEIYYSTEQACLDGMYSIERVYSDVKYKEFSYKLECRERDAE